MSNPLIATTDDIASDNPAHRDGWTGLALVCWILLMIGGMITHARFGQYKNVALCLGLLAVAAFVAWGRFGPESFTG